MYIYIYTYIIIIITIIIYIYTYPPWNYPGGVVPLQIVEGHNVFSTKWMGLATGISTKWGEHRKQYKMTGHLPKQVILDE